MLDGRALSRKVIMMWTLPAMGLCLFVALPFATPLHSQQQYAAVDFVLPDLGKMSGSERTLAIGQLARQIRTFSGCAEKAALASELADAADDVPDDTLHEIATTWSEALKGCPVQFDGWYLQLARLVRYSHMQAPLDDPRLTAAMAAIEVEDREIQEADFTLTDLHGKTWVLKDLRGKVVLLNFWQAGCLPCVHEIPALDALYGQLQKKGLVILAISADDDATSMRHFLAAHRVSYPVLLDPERKVNELFHVGNIPRSIVFDRTGKIVAQVIGSRTQKQFAETLSQAGLH
jgi:peroxiredoxin